MLSGSEIGAILFIGALVALVAILIARRGRDAEETGWPEYGYHGWPTATEILAKEEPEFSFTPGRVTYGYDPASGPDQSRIIIFSDHSIGVLDLEEPYFYYEEEE